MEEPRGPLESLLIAGHLTVPDALPELVDAQAEALGARSVVVYLADTEQRWLLPLVPEGGPELDAQEVDGTMAGLGYQRFEPVETVDDDGATTLWVPMVDGTERIGVLRLVFPGAVDDRQQLQTFASLVTELVVSKGHYGDYFELARRSRPLTVSAELSRQVLPPTTFGTEAMIIAAATVATDDLGGDAYDYSVGRRHAHVAIFDGMGHGLDAGLLATTAVAAYRNGRRSRLGLRETAEHIGRTMAQHFGESRFVTGALTTLDVGTGRLSWCIAGHPPPLLLRRGKAVKELDGCSGMPFGVGPPSEVCDEVLEPGDRVLLYTDGVTDAVDQSGEPFGLDRLVDLISRSTGDSMPPETMRRLTLAISDHSEGPMRDDATVVMVEWRGGHDLRPGHEGTPPA